MPHLPKAQPKHRGGFNVKKVGRLGMQAETESNVRGIHCQPRPCRERKIIWVKWLRKVFKVEKARGKSEGKLQRGKTIKM